MCNLLLGRRQDALAAVDLDPLVLTCAHNAHRRIPADTEHLDTLATDALGLRLAFFLETLAANRVYTLADNTVLVGLGGSDIPDTACAVVTSGDQTVGAVRIAS